jgi:hypothetical protein
MKTHENTDCVDLLLSLVFYETFCRKLSPEMNDVLQGHLETCASCRDRMLAFRRMLGGHIRQRNFG